MKKILTATLAFLICLTFCGCKKNQNANVTFVTSCYPMYIIALNLTEGIDNINVSNMAENHRGCLHNFQLEAEDLKKIEKSSAFIINGAGMESFLDKVINELPDIKIIDSGIGIDLIKDEDCDCEESNCHHEYNPHTWVSISNYIKQVENIAQGLSKIDPSHSNQYLQNSESYIKKLNDLKSTMHSELENIQTRNIITFHEAFPYFAQEFNLNIVSVINHEPENEPVAKEISENIEIIKKFNIQALFTEPQYSDKAAEIISKETGAKIYTLDPAVTGTDSKDSYINAMQKNLEVLKSALN